MADEPKLIVAVEARLDRFERQLKQAGLIAERELKNIEQKTSGITFGVTAGNLLSSAIQKAMSSAVDEIKRVIDEMQKLNDVLRLTGLTAEQFQRVAFAGLSGGLGADAISAGLEAVGAKMNDINRGETDLSKFLDANNLKYKERNGLVSDANKGLELAATLMGKAGSEFEKVRIAEKFGLTKDWVKVLGDGVDKFREMKDAAKVDENLARSLQHMDAIAKLATRISAELKAWGSSLTVHVLPVLETILSTVEPIVASLANVMKTGPLEEQGQRGLERIRHTLDLVREARKEAEGPLRITVNKPSGVVFPKEGTTEKDALEKQVEALRKINALAETELGLVGQTTAKQEEARQITLLQEAAKRAGLDAETAITEEMRKQAALGGEIKQKLVERQAAWSEMMSASRELGSIMSDAMKGLVLEGKKFDEVLKNIGNRLASKAFDKLFDIMFAAPAGGGGSIFTNLLGIKSVGARMAGGPVKGGGAYMVGERGPELFMPKRSGRIVPNTALGAGGRGMNVVGPTTNVVVQGSADAQTIGLMQQMLAARDRRFVADVAHATTELRRRSAFA